MEQFKTPIRYGIIGALVMCIFSFITYIFYRQLFSSFYVQIAIGILSFILTLIFPIVGGLKFRKDRGDVLSFKDALTGVMIICTLTFAGSTLMGYLIPNVIDQEYPQELMQLMKTTMQDSMEKFGASDEEIEKAMERMDEEKFKPTLLQSAKGFGISLGIGLVLSMIIAAFIRRAPKPIAQAEDSAPAA